MGKGKIEMNIVLTERIRVLEKPKSTAKLWSKIDTYPADLLLSFNLGDAMAKYTNSVKVTVMENGKSWGDSALNIKRLLSNSNYEVLK